MILRKNRLTILLAGILAAFGIGYYWFMASFQLPHDIVPKTAKTKLENLGEYLNSLDNKIKKGDIPSRKLDTTSVGNPKMEFKLLTFRHWIEVYGVSFGNLPGQSSDLNRLVEEGSLKAEQKKLIRDLINQCQIFRFTGGDSYLLNCDGWQLQTPQDAQRVTEHFDSETEKFYVSDGHIFLYAPLSSTGSARP